MGAIFKLSSCRARNDGHGIKITDQGERLIGSVTGTENHSGNNTSKTRLRIG